MFIIFGEIFGEIYFFQVVYWLKSFLNTRIIMEHCAGACSVMVIVIGNEHIFQVQILDSAVCISHSTNTFRKDMNPTICKVNLIWQPI